MAHSSPSLKRELVQYAILRSWRFCTCRDYLQAIRIEHTQHTYSYPLARSFLFVCTVANPASSACVRARTHLSRHAHASLHALAHAPTSQIRSSRRRASLLCSVSRVASHERDA
eukprot:6188649-Pleurochrysis_carterae.AAC.1